MKEPAQPAQCPKCGSADIQMFTSDDDMCKACGATFSAVISGNGAPTLAAEVERLKQQEIINDSIIQQLQIRVEQDIQKIKKLNDNARDHSAWQSEYRAARAEVERLKIARDEQAAENLALRAELDKAKDSFSNLRKAYQELSDESVDDSDKIRAQAERIKQLEADNAKIRKINEELLLVISAFVETANEIDSDAHEPRPRKTFQELIDERMKQNPPTRK